ncbi:MAG: HAMP domain-containing protein [Desulfobacter sp.]|nr:MAG: HAMP domain-containing protein [Desulfobacter sp.]
MNLLPYRLMHSFRLRIFSALILIIILVIPGTGYFCFIQATRIIEHQMQAFAIGSADQISKRVEAFLSHHTYNVQLIKSLFEQGLIDMTDDNEILRYFQLFRREHPEFFNINFGDETGRFLMSPAQIPEVHATFDPRIRPWYQGALTSLGVHWTKVYLFASTQKPGITVSVPIYDADRKLQAVCGIDIDISSFSKFLGTIKIGSRGVAYMFDRETGRVIAHPALVRSPRNPFRADLLRQVYQDMAPPQALSDESPGKKFAMTSYQDRQYFTAYADYPDSRWVVGVTLPVSDLFENVSEVRRNMIGLVFGGIFLASLLSYLIALNIVRPMARLKQGIERISSGDLDHKVDIRDPDIAAALASAFNRMAASLKTSSTELERTYKELARSEKLAAVGQMTAGIAHEIKNPLGIIQGAAQVVANPDRPLEMREKAALFIMDEVERLNNTLTAFLDFAKPPSPRFRPMDLTLLMGEILDGFKVQYGPKGYTFNTDMEQAEISGDADQLRQVFYNLLLNAVQAMPKGGSVSVNLTRGAEDTTIVAVEDRGCGIGQTEIEKIFDPFVSFRDKGIGLGLSVVNQITESHSAEISCTSTPGKGTCFTLVFPSLKEDSPNGGTDIID